jgi:hypothetical protein
MPEPCEWLGDFWDRYLHRSKDRRIVMWRDNVYHVIPYTYRGHPQYMHKQDDKIEAMSKHWPMDGAVLLTISPRRTGSPLKTLLDIRANLNRFFSWLRRKKHGNRCCYVWALEGGLSGNAHLHIALATKWVASIDDLRDWWRRRGIDIERPGIDVKSARGIAQVQSYVLKYVTKSNKDNLFTALLYLTGSRQWGGSWRLMGLSPRPVTNSNSKWTYLGCFDIEFVRLMFDGQEKPPDPGIYTTLEGKTRSEWSDFWALGHIPLSPETTGMESRRTKWRPS